MPPPVGTSAPDQTGSGPYVAPEGINPGGLSTNGIPPVVPTMYDQWLTSYQPYQNALNATAADRVTQIAQSAKGISDALGLWGGDLSAFKDALTSTLGASALGAAGQQFLNAFDWNAIQNASTQATSGGVATLAQLAKAQGDRQAALESDLANRGIFWSGQNTAATQANETQRAQDQWSEQQRLMQYLTGLSSAFAQSENQRVAGINTAANDAYAYYNNPDNQIPGAANMSGAVGAGDPTGPAPAWTPPADPGAPPRTSTIPDSAAQAAYRRRRAAAQAAAARARAQAQWRAG